MADIILGGTYAISYWHPTLIILGSTAHFFKKGDDVSTSVTSLSVLYVSTSVTSLSVLYVSTSVTSLSVLYVSTSVTSLSVLYILALK